jgi:hypothetical protein
MQMLKDIRPLGDAVDGLGIRTSDLSPKRIWSYNLVVLVCTKVVKGIKYSRINI